MPRPDPALLRVSFKTFLGEDKYRKFLEAGVGQLRFWQERVWAEFVESHPDLAVTSTERTDALDVCPEHERPLHTGFTGSMEGMYFRPTTAEERRLFPRAPLLPVLASGPVRVRYCPDCVEAKAKYADPKK